MDGLSAEPMDTAREVGVKGRGILGKAKRKIKKYDRRKDIPIKLCSELDGRQD